MPFVGLYLTISTIEPVTHVLPSLDCASLSIETLISYADKYVSTHQRLPNFFLASYPEYVTRESFFNIRPFFNHVKGIGVEIGTFEGYNATNVLKYCSLEKLYCIDPYRPYVDEVGGLGGLAPETWDALYEKVQKRVEGGAEVIRKPSLEAVNNFVDNSLDFVYLDGDHSRENVLKEINSWLPKVKVGGILGGHDCKETGVLGAVTEWGYNNPQYNNMIYTQSNDWWLIKQ